MSVYHVKSTGSRSSGASTADIWTDANCYASFNAALIASGDGDELILDDEDHTDATPAAGANWNENKTISSRSGDPENCSYGSSAADQYTISVSPGGGNDETITFNNIKITRSVTQTGAKGLFYSAGGAGTILAINFNNCILGDITNVSTIVNQPGMIFQHTGADDPVVTFTNCKIRNITATFTSGGYGMVIKMSTGSSTPSLVFDNCEFTDWTVTQGAASFGLVYLSTFMASVSFSDCLFADITHTGGTKPVIYQAAAVPLTFLNCRVLRILRDGSTNTAGGAFMSFKGAHQIEGVYAEDVVNDITISGVTGDGVLLYQSTATAVGKISDIEVHRCHGRSGAAIFCSNGASANCENIRAYDCQVAHGAAVYVGYNGDADINGVLVKDCVAHPVAAGANGLALYFRNNPVAPARDSYCNISNVTLINNDNDGLTEGIEVQNDHATSTVTARLDNVISRNVTANKEIQLTKTAGTGTFDVTMNSCNVKGGASAIVQADGTQTTLTNNDLTSDDPLLNSDASLPVGSALSAIGVRWWLGANPVGAGGEPFSNNDTDIGAIQGTDAENHPFHPLNL